LGEANGFMDGHWAGCLANGQGRMNTIMQLLYRHCNY